MSNSVSAATPQPTTASYPFNKANADIILRTSDHVDFHVYSQILIAASPFFESMFEVPQPPVDQQQLKYGRPIINISETSKALDPLLRICYPINKTKERSLEEIELALSAALKFEMELPITMLTEELDALAPYRPLEIWGVGCRLDLESVAYCAAQNMSLAPPDFTVLGDMSGITAADYFRLREYHRLQHKVPRGFKFLNPHATSLRHSSLLPSLRPLSEMEGCVLAENPAPDLICRSEDGIEFRTHTTVLSLASPSLRQKVVAAVKPLPKGGSHEESELPVVQFDEAAIVLHAMLRLIYPSPSDVSLPKDVGDLTAVLVSIDKYSLDSEQPAVWSFWQAIASTDALRAYCHAISAGHILSAKEAARCMLNQVLDGVYVEELESTPALAYHRLLLYYEKCRAVAKEESTKISTSLVSPKPVEMVVPESASYPVEPSLPGGKKKKAAKRSCRPTSSPEPWLTRYLKDLSSRLRSRPGSTTPTLSELFTEATRAVGDDSGTGPEVWCEDCQIVAEDLLNIQKGLQQLMKSVNEVELEI
ncbi:hypothetical protein BD309DRAFT_63668 [Dichomitus squalens]|uniref:Uncharacterized protein n=1 Tax=Dichomitus squalens TaxID=114155 RepID=A0A4Q9NS32_9APHY|nr:hypothetical protein BD309DRAFT_63668 [Dichomitus squalens]TBU53703.1 hypothetical protein BD310DRAFT_134381 [Dichomitus squalens]